VSAVLYWFLWVVFRLTARVLFRYRVVGAELIPNEGGLIVAANHASYLDIPMLGCGMRRRVAFLGRQDLFPILGFRWLIRWLGWIPIRHDRLSREGFRKAISLLKAGKVVAIYPEGGRSLDGKLRVGKHGIGVLVAETGCRVLPAYLGGTFDALPPQAKMIRPRPITVTFGAPLDLSAEASRCSTKEFYRVVSRTVMTRIAELGNVPPPGHPSERVNAPTAPGSPAFQR
jgi:1-acyl-sn-glycerol-3-phosphate acyltransferase